LGEGEVCAALDRAQAPMMARKALDSREKMTRHLFSALRSRLKSLLKFRQEFIKALWMLLENLEKT